MPDQALGMRMPADVYALRAMVNSEPRFAGRNVGVTQVGERLWLVTFMRYDLGYLDDQTRRLEPIDNPFAPRLLPMSPE